MFEILKTKLETLGTDAWELTELQEKRWEFYFIRHELDQNRSVNTRTYEVKVYKSIEGGKFIGSASGEISPALSEGEIDKTLSELLSRAGLVKNKPYSITSKPVSAVLETKEIDVSAIAESFLEAVRSVKETETEDINSYELFVSEKKKRFLNSNGVSFTCVYPGSMLEIVINARREGHEIELYRAFNSGSCDKEKIKADVTSALRVGRDRLNAVATPELGDIDVVLSTSDAVSVYEYFLDNLSAGFKVRGMSDWEAGKPISDELAGDRISFEILSRLENSSYDYPVDDEGREIEDRYIIRDGVAEGYWGSRQFCEYLGIESSDVLNFRCTGGTKTEEELRSGDYIEPVEFSDFQVDSVSGSIAGEIRLAYLHRGGETLLVTGGSVSGDMSETLKTMTMSEKLRQYNCAVIPEITRLRGLRLNGAERK